MDDIDLTEARLIRLRQDIDGLLSDSDPQVRQDIFRLLSIGAREGLDLFPRFRDAIAHRPGLPAPDGGAELAGSHGLEMEALPERHRATLWPYRPKRRREELLSSWLWRTAQGLAAPPRRFALDAIGVQLADVDREIGDAALDRLGFLSGQSTEHLLGGTLRADIKPLAIESRPRVHQAVMLYGDLVLQRQRRGRCVGPIIQYCPVCLARSHTAFLRRGWRFSFEVACWDDGCLLLDSRWKCGAAVNPLAQAVPSSDFRCAKCHARLAEAVPARMDKLIAAQTVIYTRIERLAFFCNVDFISPFVADYLKFLATAGLRGTNPANTADRVACVIQEYRRIIDADAALRRKPAHAAGRKQPAVTTPRNGAPRRRRKVGRDATPETPAVI